MDLSKLLEDSYEEQGEKQPRNPVATRGKLDAEIPLYNERGRQLNKKKNKLSKGAIIAVCVAAFFALLIGSIYVPQFFMSEADNLWLVAPDPDAIQLRTAQILMQPDADFDNDGLTNQQEQQLRTRTYSNDSDRDGLHDAEDSEPLVNNGAATRALMTAGGNISTPYEMSGVILWAEDEGSFTDGGVIQTMSGYRFHDFKGLAKFDGAAYAYVYENGVHTLLPYSEKEGAWKISGDCIVEVTASQQETTNKLCVFGSETYIRGGFGDFLSKILPNKGWLTCQNMWVEDTYVDAGKKVFAKRLNIPYSKNDLTRFCAVTNTLSDLVDIYRTVDDGSAVLVSLTNNTYGECVLEIIGYTRTGDLILADPNDTNNYDILHIIPMCRRSVKADGSIYLDTWFEFRGCGFDSIENKDVISFFAAAPTAAADIW